MHITVESRDYAPLTFSCYDHYQLLNATYAHDLYTLFGSLVGKTREKRLSKA